MNTITIILVIVFGIAFTIFFLYELYAFVRDVRKHIKKKKEEKKNSHVDDDKNN